jgi:hypothetical protein
MADISITGTAVKLVGGPTEDIIAGATLAGGQLVYKETATNKAKLSDNDSATAEVRAIRGMALHGAAADQPVRIAKNGAVVDVGAAVLTAGVDYYLSDTAGGICPRADVTSGHDPIRIGMAETTSHLQLDLNDPDVTL